MAGAFATVSLISETTSATVLSMTYSSICESFYAVNFTSKRITYYSVTMTDMHCSMTVKEHMRLFASLKSDEPASMIEYDIEE